MTNSRDELPPEIRSLLDHEREIPPVPALVRARALARARAAFEAGTTHRAHAPWVARPPRIRWAVAAGVTFAAAAAVGAGAYEVRLRLAQPTVVPITAPIAARPAPVPPPPAVAPAPAPEPVQEEAELPPVSHVAQASHAPRGGADREELRLLRLARAAVARQDFSSALTLLTEHARRFKDGRLSEEREALRVRALAGLGRTEEARHAAERFQARFPRSVLLPAVRQMPAAP
jgi:hypothetical protein